jgi:Rab GDP dissociation inhibitor
MNEDYDVIVLGTGLKECILSGLMSVNKKKVLHMDRNRYYGADCASLKLEQLYEKFGSDAEKKQAEEKKIDERVFGKSRDYSVDLCPKFIMSCGELTKILVHTKVTRYLDFKVVDGGYVYHACSGGTIYKVPSNPSEALTSSLVGIWQKPKFRSFLQFCAKFDENDKKTWEDQPVNKWKAKDMYDYFDLNEDTIDFTGHALALYMDDSYIQQPALALIARVKLYAHSIARYGSSPYIYPLYGLSGLPEGFSRLSAIYGGTYMLDVPCDEIVYDEAGHVAGVKSNGEIARCKTLIADPSYFANTPHVRKTGQVARWLFIKNDPLPDTDNAASTQIILPQRQTGRKSDIYISMVSGAHQIAPQGKYVAMIQANVETANPKKELEVARKLIGNSVKDFFWVSDFYVPVNPAELKAKGIFITTSYDSTSHFESATEEVLSVFEGVTGEKLDTSKMSDSTDNQDDE